MIETKDHKLLIDVIFGEKELGYCDTPDSAIIDSIIYGKGIFKNIDLVLATHSHQDHFSAKFVDSFLKNNPNSTFISTSQATSALKKNDQIITLTPGNKSLLHTKVDNINVTVFRLPHSPYIITNKITGEKYNKHENVENIGILLEVNGIKIFHSGDSHSGSINELTEYKLNEENVDIAILDRIFLYNQQGQKVVKDHINPKHLIIGHINPQRKDMFLKFAKKLFTDYKSVKVFENEMDSEAYEF